jgi:hypothetical protein
MSPRVSVAPDPLSVRESSGITTCHVAPGTPPDREGLRGRHVPYGSRPASWCGRVDTWITEIRTYLKDNILPDDSASADRIARLAKRYTLVKEVLYRCGTNDVLMWCITQEEGCELLTKAMEVSVRITRLPAHWSVKPFGTDFTGL